MAEREPEARAAAAARAQQQRAGQPNETIATMVSAVRPRPMRVAVPGDAVAAVAVEAHAGGDEPLAELGARSAGQRLAGPRSAAGAGAARRVAVPAQQPGHVDHAVVHLAGARPARRRRRAAVAARRRSRVTQPGRWSTQAPRVSAVPRDRPGQRAEGGLLGEIQDRGWCASDMRRTLPVIRTCVRRDAFPIASGMGWRVASLMTRPSGPRSSGPQGSGGGAGRGTQVLLGSGPTVERHDLAVQRGQHSAALGRARRQRLDEGGLSPGGRRPPTPVRTAGHAAPVIPRRLPCR